MLLTVGYDRPNAKLLTITSSGNTAPTIRSVESNSANFEIGGSGITVPAGAPELTQLMLPDYIDLLIGTVYANTKFCGDTERAQPIIQRLTHAAHPGLSTNYEGLVRELGTLSASDMAFIYPQLAWITSLIEDDYAQLLDAYAASGDAVTGAPLYDQLMAERSTLLRQPTWTPEALKLHYHVVLSDDDQP